ncbi:MAG TPA: hypothetical protein VFK19_02810 [Sphingomicrobium sp.]|nr:hypothetical protein [Sphingomicrobium sp.]
MRNGLVIFLVLACGACEKADWHQIAITDAERAVRTEAGDSEAQFSSVQITGDQSTGQVCGMVTARNNSFLSGVPARFIFYIDGGGGNNPWIEGNPGTHTAPDFEFNWNADCVREGYAQ